MPGKTKAKSIKNPGPAERPETTAIVLRIAADRATDFEAMFEAEEIPIWDDFTGRGLFLEARLVRAVGGSEQRRGIQDYLLHIVAADHEAHEERSEEHTSELQSQSNLVCRLLLEKKKKHNVTAMR